jgi:hypothetical protein
MWMRVYVWDGVGFEGVVFSLYGYLLIEGLVFFVGGWVGRIAVS